MTRTSFLDAALASPFGCVPGVEVGHWQDGHARTGCTVVLLPPGSVGGVDVRGGAPATHELGLLDPTAMQPHVDAYVMTGGSAPGLACIAGVVDGLRELGRGFPTAAGPVPLVPGAALFDLTSGEPRSAAAAEGRAALDARTADPARGLVGAGTGAMVGKVRGRTFAMNGGLGLAGLVLEDGLAICALSAVNALGDIVDPRSGQIVAGARADDGSFAHSAHQLASPASSAPTFESNTVLSVVITNAALTKPEATRVARMGQCGVARTISPCATSLDGDVVFAAGTGAVEASADRVGALAAEVLAASILDAAAASAEA